MSSCKTSSGSLRENSTSEHHQFQGGLPDSRYKSSLIDADGYLLQCQRYIELNPVRANISAMGARLELFFRVEGAGLAWPPRSLPATPEELAAVELSPSGLHWEALNEDIWITGLLAGRGAA